jgi:hypothetical protein
MRRRRDNQGMGRPRNPNPRAEHRGARWTEARTACFQTWGTVCWICGHDGAGEADHVIDAAGNPELFFNPEYLRPAHGHRSKCPVCRVACNQSRGRPGRKVITPPGVPSAATVRRHVQERLAAAQQRKDARPRAELPARVHACTREGGCYCRRVTLQQGVPPSRCW